MRRWLRRLGYILRQRQHAAALDEELEVHREMKQQELEEAGLEPNEAVKKARRALGNVSLVQNQVRDVWIWPWLQDVGQDIRYGCRQLGHRPGFTCIVVLTLALAVGPAAVVFSWARVILNPLPVPRSSDLVFLWGIERERGATRLPVSVPDYLDWRDRSQSVEDLAAFRLDTATVTDLDEPMRVSVLRASPSLFATWQVVPAMGRPFVASDARPGSAPVALVADQFWRLQLGGRADIIGHTLVIDGVQVEIVGVLPPQWQTKLLRDTALWLPQALDPAGASRSRRTLMVVGRLAHGTSLEAAQTEMATIARTLATEYPETNAGLDVRVLRAVDALGQSPRALLGLLGVCIAVLLAIACANVANLMLARGVGRERDLSIRTALGATRARLVRQLLVESALLAGGAGVLGVLLGHWTLEGLVAALGGGPLVSDLVVDRSVVGSTLLLALALPVLFAVGPAMRASRTDVVARLKAGVHGRHRTRRTVRKRDVLVVSQVTLAVTVLIVVAQVVRTGLVLQRIAPGFDSHDLLTFRVELRSYAYGDDDAVRRFTSRAIEALASRPGVTDVGATDHLPIADSESTLQLGLDGMADEGADAAPRAALAAVSPGYFAALHLPVLGGRSLRLTDGSDTPRVAVISDAMARRFWPDEDPVGQRFVIGAGGLEPERLEVVGIVGDVRNSDLDAPLLSQVYVPLAQHPGRRLAFLVRGPGVMDSVHSLREAMAAVDGDLPLFDMKSMAQVIGDDARTTVVMAGFFAALGGIALILAAAGLHGVLWYFVSDRTREIAIRMALGAESRQLVGMVLARGSTLVGVGVAAGLLGGYGLAETASRAISQRIWAPASVSFVLVSVGVTILALGVTSVSARRATCVNPTEALRAD